MVTRDEAEQHSYEWADGTVPYAQFGPWPRPDCSGYVGGLCWRIPVPVSTVTLVTDGWMYEIPQSDLRKADAIGHCGPGTGGNAGHIQLFIAWTATGLTIAEQAGGGPGPRHHTIKGITPGYKAYRFRSITDGPAPGPGPQEDDMRFYRTSDGSIYFQDGTDVASRLPILWPVHNPLGWEEYQYAGYTAIQLSAGIDWRWWKNGEEITPGTPVAGLPNHKHALPAQTIPAGQTGDVVA